ncbi:MAG: hypothetical protein EYC70_15400 [Planctomycetota bacterium]|nr:MAG: hypothetical protein EYC70_15400 [Planctomycetota bacterium]
MIHYLHALIPCLLAQQPFIEPAVLEGDNVAGVGLVTLIDNLAINDSGDWRVEADTDNADTNADSVMLSPGLTVFLREGDALTLPAGASLDSFDSVTLNNLGHSGWNFFLDGTIGTSDDSGIYINANLVLQESFISTSPGFSPGTPYIGFFETKINDSNRILVVASVDDPIIASTVDRALVVLDTDPSGALLGETVLAKEGDVLPGQIETVADFGTGPHNFAFNNAGSALYFADLNGDTTLDGVIYLDSTILAQEGSPGPIPGRNWENLSSRPMDLNNLGGFVFRGDLNGDTTTDEVIVQNGAVIVQEGDSLPGIAPFRLTGFGTGPLLIDDGGNVLWFGDWDDPDTTRDTGLFLNRTLLVQEGETLINGMLLESLSSTQDAFSLSDNGKWILFEGSLAGAVNGAFRASFPLTLLEPTPGIAGQVNILVANNATPNAGVHFAGGRLPGATLVNCGAGTITLDMADPRRLGLSFADAFGSAGISGNVPASLAGATILLQAVDSSNCEVSNLVVYTLQ